MTPSSVPLSRDSSAGSSRPSQQPNHNRKVKRVSSHSALAQAGLGLGSLFSSLPPSPVLPSFECPASTSKNASSTPELLSSSSSSTIPSGASTGTMLTAAGDSSGSGGKSGRKGPRVLLRRAKSFSPSSNNADNLSPPPTPRLPLPSNQPLLPPATVPPASLPIPIPLSAATAASTSSLPSSLVSPSSSPKKQPTLQEPLPTAPHWMFAPAPTANVISLPSIIGGKRRNSEEPSSAGASELGVLEPTNKAGSKSSKPSSRRSTFSLFRRNGPSSSVPPPSGAEEGLSSSSVSLSIPYTQSPQNSFDELLSPASTSLDAASHPPLHTPPPPILPALNLSSNRLSWAYGNSSSSPSSTTFRTSTPSPTVVSPAPPLSRRMSLSLTPTRQRSYSSAGLNSQSPSRPSSPFVPGSISPTNSRSNLASSIPAASTTTTITVPPPAQTSKRPTTANSETSVSSIPSTSGSKGYFSNVLTSLFPSSSSNSLPANSRNSSSSSLLHPSGPTDGGLNEFGALFDKGGDKRRRGLSVGAAALFGSHGSTDDTSRKRAGSAASLGIPTSKSGQRWSIASNGSSGNLQVPGTEVLENGVLVPPGRSRAQTDPSRAQADDDTLTFPSSSGNISGPSSPRLTFPSPPTSPTLNRRLSLVAGSGFESPRGKYARSRAGSEVSAMTRMVKEDGDTPEKFVERLNEKGKPSEIARILSTSADAFYTSALSHYLSSFDFASSPLDIALRLFLMQATLPTETQQIDRVMEAFAIRYQACNPGLWDSSDTPYVLAFSLVMLSTDQFNKSNKNKMKKEDYVKNARIDGVATEVLEYFFDQITLTPFVFVEDDEPGLLGRPELSSSSSFFGKSSSSQKEKAKLDPYHMIAMGLTGSLRVDVDSSIPPKSPFSFTGTTSFFNATTLHLAFARAPILQINNSRARAKSMSTSGPPISPTSGSPLEPVTSNSTYAVPPRTSSNGISDALATSSLKIAKIGLLSRKEDLAEGGRKSSSRKWKSWSVILTASQLLFFKDAAVVNALQNSLDLATVEQADKDDNDPVVFTIQSAFKPDAVLSLASSAAIYDSTYSKHPHVFRLVAPAGRQYLFQARDANDLNSWLAHINYAASFKTANLRVRSLVARRNSGTPTSLGLGLPPSHSPTNWQSSAVGSFASVAPAAAGSSSPSKVIPSLSERGEAASPEVPSEEILARVSEEDSSLPHGLLEALNAESEGQDQRTPMPKRTTSYTLGDDYFPRVFPPKNPKDSSSPSSDHLSFDRGPVTRAEVLRTKITTLEDEIQAAKKSLHTDLRLARNLAVLTPFRASTRERIVLATKPVEERVRQARMTLAKLVCHREVLARDLLADDRETQQRARKISGRPGSLSRAGSIPSSPLRTPRVSNSQGFPRSPGSNGGSPRVRPSSPTPVPSNGSSTNLKRSQGASSGLLVDEEDEAEMTDFGQEALTDDELDRLRAPPLMQRSQTETNGGRLRAASSANSDDLEFAVRSSSTASMSTASLFRTSPSTTSFPTEPSISSFPTESSSNSLLPSEQSEENLARTGSSTGFPFPETVEEEAEPTEDWKKTRAGKRVSLIELSGFDENRVSSLIRIREERRSEMGSS